ncbi:MAG: MFS transporter, partial [Planctomycetaceae bacterium]|nr:MFS transporter [Planctomycetaceae bacterium]
MWSLKTAQRAIIVAGCMAMIYTQLTMSPATIEFARSLGATGLHIGILGALPTLMLFMQFVAAVLANHLQHRRWIWFSFCIVQRLVLIPVAVGPWMFPEISS